MHENYIDLLPHQPFGHMDALSLFLTDLRISDNALRHHDTTGTAYCCQPKARCFTEIRAQPIPTISEGNCVEEVAWWRELDTKQHSFDDTKRPPCFDQQKTPGITTGAPTQTRKGNLSRSHWVANQLNKHEKFHLRVGAKSVRHNQHF